MTNIPRSAADSCPKRRRWMLPQLQRESFRITEQGKNPSPTEKGQGQGGMS
jgi:hypothetical protein